jgi:cytochrome c oxidase assembly factor CtaG
VALTGVFTYLLMGEHPLYAAYELAPRLIPGLSAENDQVLGGVLLSGVSSLVLVGVLFVNFLRWSRADQSGAGVSDRPPAMRRRSRP